MVKPDNSRVRVSVIVPMYNVEKYIGRCVTNLLNQTLDDLEIILVDDCSTDNTLSVLNSLLEQIPRNGKIIRVITNIHNVGSSESRNIGVKHASGQYIGFCDADDWIAPDMYDEMLTSALANGAEIVGCGIMRETPDKSIAVLYDYERESKTDLWRIHVLYSSLCNKLISRRLFETYQIESIKGLSMWDDHAVSFRLRYYSKCTVIVNKPFYHYVMNAQSLTHTQDMHKLVADHVMCVDVIAKKMASDICNDAVLADIIRYFKLEAKMQYLDERQICNAFLWQSIFPDTNQFGWRDGRFSMRQRMKMAMANFLPSVMADALLKGLQRMMNLFR